MSAQRSRGTGFTLFEVLAAVAVLGILYTVLATVAMDGLRYEGDAERRMRASLIADEVLADLEQSFAAGGSPPLGRNEAERDEFQIEVDVRPLDLAGFAAGLPAAAASDPDTAAAPPLLLVPPAQGAAPPLVEVEVIVRWVEGAYDQEIRRLTFGFDAAASAGALQGLDRADDGAPADGEAS